MAKTSDYENKLQGFANRIKTEPVQVPVQKVTPVVAAHQPGQEQQLNVWVPKELVKRLKRKGADSGQSLKEMVTEALIRYTGD